MNHELADVVCRDGEGRPIVNRTGVTRSAPNLPKAKDGLVFVRGTSADSTKKARMRQWGEDVQATGLGQGVVHSRQA